MNDIFEKLNSVFPDCEIFESVEDILKARHSKEHDIQPLFCNYGGKIRTVDDPVCKYHLKSFDPWCWERCETEYTINRLRPAFSAAYKHHKDSRRQKAKSAFAKGVSGNLWGER